MVGAWLLQRGWYEAIMATELSHEWYVTTAYAVTGFALFWLLARTWFRHHLARKALRAIEISVHDESQA